MRSHAHSRISVNILGRTNKILNSDREPLTTHSLAKKSPITELIHGMNIAVESPRGVTSEDF